MAGEFPANSKRSREQTTTEADEKKVAKVVEGRVVRRKKSPGKRFGEMFVSGDSKSVGQYVLMDVLLPAARDAIADAVSQGVERLIFGEARSSSRRTGARPSGSAGPGGHISYNRFSQNRPAEPRMTQRARATHNFDEVVLATRAEAEEVLDRLFDLIAKYEMATVSDLYDLIGEQSSFVDEKWGWTDIRDASIRRIRDGYLLDMPKPVTIDG
jgi:hypothetical protein